MPVARIYTRFPDEASELVERLRARGYTIELVDPGDFRVTPADIEIQLDRLKTEEAMAAAARFARTHDAEVFVASGVALEEPALRAAKEGAAERGNALVEGFKKLISPFRRAGAQAQATRAARRQAKLDAELAREAERKRQAAERAALLAQKQEQERQHREEEARMAAERAAIVAEERRREEEIRRREEEERRQHAEAAARLAAEEAERRGVEEEQERRREAEVAARVAEQQRLAQAEREAEQQRQAEAAKEQERRAAAEAAEAEARKRDELAARVAVAVPAAAAAPGRAVVKPEPIRRQPHNARVMKRATIAAAVVAGVLALGWGAYENRMPAHPLTNSDLVHSQAIHQDVPFGPASIGAQQPQAPPTTNTTVHPPQTQAQAQAKQAQAAPAKASPAQGGKPSPRRHARQFKSSADDVDEVAQDEVIYHGAPKHSSGQASAQQPQSGVKHYSDISDGPQ